MVGFSPSVSLGGGRKAPAKCWDEVSSRDIGYMSNQTATELVTSLQAMLFGFLWRCHIPIWKLLSSWVFNSTCEGLGLFLSSNSVLVLLWRRSCQCFYLNSVLLWWTWGSSFWQLADGERGRSCSLSLLSFLFSPSTTSSLGQSWC